MTAFIPKNLPIEETVGEKLRQARRYKNLKIEEAAKRTNIRVEYLNALEEENFGKLPAGLYGKNFLKQYAKFLGLKPRDLLKNWQEELIGDTRPDPFSQKIVKKHKFIIFPKIIRSALIITAVLICFLYLVFYFKKIVFSPDLIINQPSKNLLIQGDSITVSGQTEVEAEVKINGEIVLNNHNGYFSQNVNLKKGINNITITAKKKYSQEKTIIRQILVQ